MKLVALLLSILLASCYWLWATQPKSGTSLSDESLRKSLTDSSRTQASLQSALAKLVEHPKPTPLEASTSPALPHAENLRAEASGADLNTSDDPIQKLASIKARMERLEPGQFSTRMELISEIFQVHGTHAEAASLALGEMTSSNDGIRDAPNEWKKVYVDHLMKAYLANAGTPEGMATLSQRVESEPDATFKQILEDRYAVNRIPDLERRPASGASTDSSI